MEIFGVASGAIGIASAFTCAVDVFDYVQVGRHLGRDYETKRLRLASARLRLSRWGKAVNVYEDAQLGNPNATPDEVRMARESILQILVLFEGSMDIARRFVVKGEQVHGEAGTEAVDPVDVAIQNKMKEMAKRRMKAMSLLKITSWALYRADALDKLIEGIDELLDNLERAFPATERRLELVREDAVALGDVGNLERVEEVTSGMDDQLERAVAEIRTGARYTNIKGVRSVVHTGHNYTPDWKGGSNPSSATYDGLEFEDSKVLVGDNYGGNSFW